MLKRIAALSLVTLVGGAIATLMASAVAQGVPINIDATISLAAIGGGAFGALFAALLSYQVQKRIRTWEENRKRVRLVHVHIIQLADVLGGYGYFGQIFKSVGADMFSGNSKSYTVAQQMAAALAAGLEQHGDDALRAMLPLVRRGASMAKDAVDKAWLKPVELADLPLDAARWYSRYMGSAISLAPAIEAIGDGLAKEPIKRPTVAELYNVCVAFGRYFDYGAKLFHAFCVSVGFGLDQEKAYLMNGVEYAMTEVNAAFGGVGDLEDAINVYKQWEEASKQQAAATEGR